MLETDAVKARAVARAYMSFYLQVPYYQDSLRAIGFSDADCADGGSDQLVDTVVAWGKEDTLRQRIDAHYQAGATHVCILPLSPDGGMIPDERARSVGPTSMMCGRCYY